MRRVPVRANAQGMLGMAIVQELAAGDPYQAPLHRETARPITHRIGK